MKNIRVKTQSELSLSFEKFQLGFQSYILFCISRVRTNFKDLDIQRLME